MIRQMAGPVKQYIQSIAMRLFFKIRFGNCCMSLKPFFNRKMVKVFLQFLVHSIPSIS